MIQVAIELETLADLHVALVGGKRFVGSYDADTNRPGTSGGEGGLSLSAPWIDPPQDFLAFDEMGTVNLPAAPSADTAVLTMTVPEGFDGVIKAYSLNFTGGGFVNGSGDIVYRITQDGRPMRNFSNITSEKGTPQEPRPISGGIRIYSGQVIQVVVNHASNVGLAVEPVIATLVGYFYPSKGN